MWSLLCWAVLICLNPGLLDYLLVLHWTNLTLNVLFVNGACPSGANMLYVYAFPIETLRLILNRTNAEKGKLDGCFRCSVLIWILLTF